ncbi:MAG TPA: hypothetical protein PKN96_08870 [Flavobacterium sp.]|uniref:hypothetical protein n=1 Tax=Flavobacterium sp. TaxID=239 RepID=UPI002C68E9F9|nr:hypothetical protein [Flavobacterium sp.]HNP33392.1 hypothetical protein [Flavobacterium sp.]
MEKLKSNWKLVIYWFVVMSFMNVYIIPKFINHEPITNRRIIIGIVVSLIVSLLMGLFITPKPANK